MGKKKRKPAVSRPMTRKQRSRAEHEARMNRWIIIGAASLGLLAVGVLVYGYLAEVVLKGREPVAVVNGVPVSAADFEAQVRYQRTILRAELNTYQARRMELDPTDPEATSFLEQLDEEIRNLDTQLLPEYAVVLGQQVLSEMVQGELIRQEAARRGLAVSPEEIDEAIEQYFGYSEDPSDESPVLPIAGPVTTTGVTTSTGAVAREQFEELYRGYVETFLESSGLGEEGLRDLIESSLLYEQVRGAIAEAVPAVAEQLQRRYFAFPTLEEATEVVDRLDAGEDWEDIASEIEADEASSASVSRLTWQTRGFVTEQLGEQLGGLVVNSELGAYTRPLPGADGQYYVVQVLAREERELDPLMLGYEQNRVFEEWLAQQWQQIEYSDDWQEKVPTEP